MVLKMFESTTEKGSRRSSARTRTYIQWTNTKIVLAWVCCYICTSVEFVGVSAGAISFPDADTEPDSNSLPVDTPVIIEINEEDSVNKRLIETPSLNEISVDETITKEVVTHSSTTTETLNTIFIQSTATNLSSTTTATTTTTVETTTISASYSTTTSPTTTFTPTSSTTTTEEASTTSTPTKGSSTSSPAAVTFSTSESTTEDIMLKCSSDHLSDTSQKDSTLCLTEDCVLAAATILASLDRSVDHCEDFYEFACGGWIQRSTMPNTDRFTTVDKRNQNIVRRILESPEDTEDDEVSAEDKAKRFYKSCVSESSEEEKRNMHDLQATIKYAGGWYLTGKVGGVQNSYNDSFSFDKRVQMLHNSLGTNVFFTWGVIEHEGSNRLAVIAGGWNDALVVEEGDREEYLKLMSMYTMLLSQADEEAIVVDVEVVDDGNDANDDNVTTLIDFTYEYEDLEEDDLRSSHKEDNNFSDYTVLTDNNEAATLAITGPMDSGNSDTDDLWREDNTSDIGGGGGGGVGDTTATFDNRLTGHYERPNLLPSYEDNFSALLEERLKIESALSAVIDFEEALANITNKPVDSSTLVPYRIEQLSTDFPFLNWTLFFNTAFNKVGTSPQPDTKVLVQEEFLTGVDALVRRYRAEGRHEVLINYMTWRLVAAFYPDRPPDESQRRERCLKETEDMFAPAVTAMYIRAKGIGKSRETVEQVTMMVETMQNSFQQNFGLIKWMSSESSKAASAKLKHMVDLIGYPAYVLNNTWLNIVYNDLKIDTDAYLMNLVVHRAFARQMELRDYFRPLLRGSWNDFSHMANIATVNAYYNQATNTMVVPIGMLQPPLFWSRPKSLTFGAFGIVVAHEITHAFDDVGIMYDEAGSYKALYDNDTVTAFHEASDCIRQQYSRFTVAGLNVDGNVTLGENIADHGGLKIAEVAYDDWLGLNGGQDATLPALEGFSAKQLFYLGYALPWCAIHTDSMLRNHVLKDEHAPDKFRVLGPLSNSQKFADVWGCAVGDTRMNPADKCQVW